MLTLTDSSHRHDFRDVTLKAKNENSWRGSLFSGLHSENQDTGNFENEIHSVQMTQLRLVGLRLAWQLADPLMRNKGGIR